uniref:START domain-containing protein n=1 Tax=Panagrolaimus superbus TaxID=310955 RepID=A0A914XVG0_9BILA
MTVDNLSICTMPTVFTLSDISQSATPNRRRKTVAIMNGKDAMPYTSLKLALSLLISHRSELDTIPPYILKAANMKNPKKKKDLKDSMAPLQDIGVAASLRCFVAQLFKENDEYWKSWRIEFIHENGILISTREVDDPCALKSCRLQLTVQASPKQVVSALINHSEKWDLITTSTKATFIDFSNKEDIANITYKNFNNAAIKRSTVARIWEDDEPGTGKAYLAQKTCKSDPLSSNVHIYHTAFIICPFKEKSVINYVNRIDLKGKPADWYDKTYRQLLISQMNCLASLFKNK